MYSLVRLRAALDHCFESNLKVDIPYTYWQLQDIFPAEVVDALLALQVEQGDMDYRVGRREINNSQRAYFDTQRRETTPVCDAIARLFQSQETIAAIKKTYGSDINKTYLRIEFAQDTDGFWLEPHTDLGVKKFTMFVYLSRDKQSHSWGTSLYTDPQSSFFNTSYKSNGGLIFHPSASTWHGFAKRPMNGVRKSLIINYVTDEWRARNELAFPDTPVVA